MRSRFSSRTFRKFLIIADKTANPDYIAIDMMAQAEHDPNAACVLVTTSETLGLEVDKIVRI